MQARITTLFFISGFCAVEAFQSAFRIGNTWVPLQNAIRQRASTTESITCLYSTPPRKPRRSLQKRRKRTKDVEEYSFTVTTPEDDLFWETSESRPLVAANAKEAGEDYWIDEEALRQQKERSQRASSEI